MSKINKTDKNKIHICTLCDYSTTDNSNWGRHIKTLKHLNNEKRINAKLCCKNCGKQFTRSDNKKVHEKKCVVNKNINDSTNTNNTNNTNNTTNTNTTNTNTTDTNTNNINTNDNTNNSTNNTNTNDNSTNNTNTSNNDIEKIFKKLTDLEQTISQTKPSPPVIQNTTTLEPLTAAVFAEHLKDLQLDFIKDGGKGYATFAIIYTFQDKVICTDKSRKKVRFCDSAGEIINDYGCVQLCQLFFENTSQHSTTIINAEYSRLQKEVQKIAEEGRAGTSDVTSLLEQSIRLQNIRDQSLKAAKGDQNELTQEFIRNLVKNLKPK